LEATNSVRSTQAAHQELHYLNYLYLSQKLEEITDAESREALLDAVAHGSTVAWQHLDLLGEYDFSAEKLRDGVEIRLPKLKG
jgi:hypothetical protein